MMRVFRSFLMRFTQLIAAVVGLCFLVMSATMYINLQPQMGLWFAVYAGLCLVWVLAMVFLIRKRDPELVVEVAKFLYPGGALVSLLISFLMMGWLQSILDTETLSHVPVIFVGVLVAGFLVVRCWDLKWLRNEEELHRMHEMDERY